MRNKFLTLCLLVISWAGTAAVPSAGFFLPDSVFEFTMHYKTINNLIILPVTINDSVRVNLILDTGCRNMLLFGKRFESLFRTSRAVEFSGLGSGDPVKGKLSLDNHVSIQAVTGKRIPIIIVPQKNLFSSLPNVHGIIGYEIFAKFEIELNFPRKLITFRTAAYPTRSADFDYVDMKVVDSKPVLECTMTTGDGIRVINDLLIDTGSCLGLILSVDRKGYSAMPTALGRGLNGIVNGEKVFTKRLKLKTFEFTNVVTSIVYSKNSYASIGMDILKDHVIILNYSRSYVAFRKNIDS
jgi:hypothetical protein